MNNVFTDILVRLEGISYTEDLPNSTECPKSHRLSKSTKNIEIVNAMLTSITEF